MQPISQSIAPLLGYSSPIEQPYQEEAIPLGLLAFVAKQQEDAQKQQVVQNPALNARMPDYREMSAVNFMANLFGSGSYTGLLSPLMPAVAAGIASGDMPMTYQRDPGEVQQFVNERIRSMSPEEYKRFAVYK